MVIGGRVHALGSNAQLGLGDLMVAEAEIAVDQARAIIISGGDARRLERLGIGLALIAQGIEPRRANHRRRKSREIFGAQRRDAPIRAVRRIGEIVTGEPFHDRARQEVAFRVFRARGEARILLCVRIVSNDIGRGIDQQLRGQLDACVATGDRHGRRQIAAGAVPGHA